MNNKITIRLPFKTPTINHLYWHKGNMKIMKTDAKRIREEIVDIVKKSLPFAISNIDNGLKVTVEVHEDWFTKEGKVKKKDIANREKFLIDSVFNSLGIDDKFIFEHHLWKVQNDLEEFSIIKIEEIRL